MGSAQGINSQIDTACMKPFTTNTAKQLEICSEIKSKMTPTDPPPYGLEATVDPTTS